ncbi:MAG TPA: transcriptional repressor [Longimicrobium sp.]|nr:transcriptional repressor [Longimicrobium sp.]
MPATATPRPEQTEALLRRALEAHGQRYTEQRAAVFRFLAGTYEHPSADEVFTAVRGEIPDISLATVYKALETLVSCGLAVKLTYGDDSARYDARTDDHYHSRCLRCGIVRDVPGESVEMPRVEVGDGFRVQGFRVEVVGYCPTCAATLE